ncbi:MAG: thiamine pyrophosphate-dependent dehydrogenase E1 component subunit alpha [Candidatus Jacksonbacteria bacterium]|nr:thiamine pyrophosphate-dependent dehydrogenase E1 component subunit alpha [Candidatus Jacksonbacteria bacterium]
MGQNSKKPRALSKKTAAHIYRSMVRIRLAEEKIAEGVTNGEIKTPCHLYIGQEAVAAGLIATLKKTDYVFGNHRSHGHYIAKGGDMKAMFAEIYGKTAGCSGGRGGSMHLIARDVGFLGAQPLVAGTIPLALGAALASSITEDKRVVVSFFGDGAVEEGVFHESLNFAAVKKLPLIFVCENNLYSSHLHISERRAKNNIYTEALAYGIPSFQVDGQDICAIYTLVKKYIHTVRFGMPLFIEALTYRFCGHVGAYDTVDDQHTLDIRESAEVARWKKRDPIVLFEKYALSEKLLTQKKIVRMQNLAQKEVSEAYTYALQAPYPKQQELTHYVFA